MSEHTLKSIKRDSIRRVYDCISSTDFVTRLEIAKMTGLSLMTVGKITDALLEKKIVQLEKVSSSRIGRKAEYVKLHKACAAIVMEENMISIVSVSLDEVDSKSYADIDSAIKFLIDNSIENLYVGIALVGENVPAELVEKAKSLFGISDIIKSDMLIARAIGQILDLKKQYKTGLYVYADLNISRGAYFDSDTTVDDIRFGEILGENVEQKAYSSDAIAKFFKANKIFLDSALPDLESHINSAVIQLSDCKNDEISRVGAARVLFDTYINITKRL